MKLLGSICLVHLTMGLSAFSQGLSVTDTVESDAPGIGVDYETAHLSKVVGAVRINESITVDGYLNEPAWQLASPATDFVQQLPNPGEPSRERTEARFLYDDDNLYVGVILFYSDAANIVARGLSYDFPPRDTDSINVVIDSLRDRRSGFSFTTNPLGAKRDQQLSNDGRGNLDWYGVWDVEASVNDGGWIAEFMIPFKTLRFSNSRSQEWGLNIGRYIVSLNEKSQWSPVPVRYSQFRVSIAGTLTGLENISQGRNLTVKPYAAAGIVQSRSSGGQIETVSVASEDVRFL